jgi:CubicO group peptidase (beta-lactamase class C family)
VVIDRNGKELFAHAGGTLGYGSDKPMTLDNIFWIASCTKMLVGIACMQLVEKGSLSLDDSAQVERLCPELKAVKVLQDDGTLVEKNRSITLRMLLSHSGMCSRSSGHHSVTVTDHWLYNSWVWIYLLQRKAPQLQQARGIRRVLWFHPRYQASAISQATRRRLGIRCKSSFNSL